MRRRAAGFTLVELVVATGLASVLMVALFRLLDLTLDMWTRGETRRAMVERASATAELFAADLRALHPGGQGDLLAEWVPFDADGVAGVDRWWPRIRLVRQASIEDLARLAAEAATADLDPALVARAAEEGVEPAALIAERAAEAGAETFTRPVESGLVEVAWAVLPAARSGDGIYEGVLVRGERVLGAQEPGEIFEPGWFSAAGEPPAGATREVTGGVLWLGMQFATQTTVVWDGWRLGGELADAAASWDAWNRGRPDEELTVWNEPGAGMPATENAPLLPRRVRLELEFQTPKDRARRTRLALPVDKTDSVLRVEEPDALPGNRATHVLVGGEWMEIASSDGERLSVRRGARGTEPAQHEIGDLVQWGEPIVVEVPIATHSDDWNMSAGRRR